MRELQREIKDQYKVSPYLAIFLISSIQIGVGVLGFQSYIVGYLKMIRGWQSLLLEYSLAFDFIIYKF